MTMSVGKISNVQFLGSGSRSSYNRSGSDDTGLNRGRIQERNNNYNNNVTNSQLRNAAKAMVSLLIGGAALGSATVPLHGCAEAEAYAEANDSILKELLNRKDSCGCCIPTQIIHTRETIPGEPVIIYKEVPGPVVHDTIPGDTTFIHDTIPGEPIIIPGPVVHDTIPGEPQIIEHWDTLKIKPNFKSPVIDTLNMILHDLGNDTTGGYIPLKISFIDEMDTKYKKALFDGQASAPDNIFYNAKHSPWSDAEGKFIIGTPLDESVKYMLSLTGDGKLFVMKMIPKTGVTAPKGLDDYMYSFENYVFDRDQASKLIKKFNVARDQVGREYAGTLEKADQPKTIMLTNPYDTKWRWTNINVTRGDAPTDLE